MQDLAILLRAAQFFAHNAHNLASGETFFEDHEYFGELYGAYESAYDGVIERIIGLGDTPNLVEITVMATDKLKAMGEEDAFAVLMKAERDICAACDAASEGETSGTINFLQGLADASEQRQYKLRQRIKEEPEEKE